MRAKGMKFRRNDKLWVRNGKRKQTVKEETIAGGIEQPKRKPARLVEEQECSGLLKENAIRRVHAEAGLILAREEETKSSNGEWTSKEVDRRKSRTRLNSRAQVTKAYRRGDQTDRYGPRK